MRITVNQPFVLAGAEPMYEENAWKYLHNTVGLRTAFDIGARDSTLPHVFPTVALFEPNASTCAALRRKFPESKVYQYAIGSTSGLANYYSDWESLHRRYVHVQSTCDSVQVHVRTFEDAVADAGFVPEFVKIDTEGHELAILQGMKEKYLDTGKVAALQFEVGGTMFDAGYTIHDLLKCFDPATYTVYNIAGVDVLAEIDRDTIHMWPASVRGNSNLLAMRRVL
jgi:FkbM family methyltransferase